MMVQRYDILKDDQFGMFFRWNSGRRSTALTGETLPLLASLVDEEKRNSSMRERLIAGLLENKVLCQNSILLRVEFESNNSYWSWLN